MGGQCRSSYSLPAPLSPAVTTSLYFFSKCSSTSEEESQNSSSGYPARGCFYSTGGKSAKGTCKTPWDTQGWSLWMPLEHQRAFSHTGHCKWWGPPQCTAAFHVRALLPALTPGNVLKAATFCCGRDPCIPGKPRKMVRSQLHNLLAKQSSQPSASHKHTALDQTATNALLCFISLSHPQPILIWNPSLLTVTLPTPIAVGKRALATISARNQVARASTTTSTSSQVAKSSDPSYSRRRQLATHPPHSPTLLCWQPYQPANN